MQVRTSSSHPLRIDEVACAPEAAGIVGITFCPGKCGDSVFGAPWKRDLAVDVAAIKTWGASVVLTLVEQHELEMIAVPDLGDAIRAAGIEWLHLPIRDLQPPDAAFHSLWDSKASAALRALQSGRRVVVHCRGGLGRAGTVACMLLIEIGVPWPQAIERVRRSRPGAVETKAQEAYVRQYAARLGRIAKP